MASSWTSFFRGGAGGAKRLSGGNPNAAAATAKAATPGENSLWPTTCSFGRMKEWLLACETGNVAAVQGIVAGAPSTRELLQLLRGAIYHLQPETTALLLSATRVQGIQMERAEAAATIFELGRIGLSSLCPGKGCGECKECCERQQPLQLANSGGFDAGTGGTATPLVPTPPMFPTLANSTGCPFAGSHPLSFTAPFNLTVSTGWPADVSLPRNPRSPLASAAASTSVSMPSSSAPVKRFGSCRNAVAILRQLFEAGWQVDGLDKDIFDYNMTPGNAAGSGPSSSCVNPFASSLKTYSFAKCICDDLWSTVAGERERMEMLRLLTRPEQSAQQQIDGHASSGPDGGSKLYFDVDAVWSVKGKDAIDLTPLQAAARAGRWYTIQRLVTEFGAQTAPPPIVRHHQHQGQPTQPGTPTPWPDRRLPLQWAIMKKKWAAAHAILDVGGPIFIPAADVVPPPLAYDCEESGSGERYDGDADGFDGQPAAAAHHHHHQHRQLKRKKPPHKLVPFECEDNALFTVVGIDHTYVTPEDAQQALFLLLRMLCILGPEAALLAVDAKGNTVLHTASRHCNTPALIAILASFPFTEREAPGGGGGRFTRSNSLTETTGKPQLTISASPAFLHNGGPASWASTPSLASLSSYIQPSRPCRWSHLLGTPALSAALPSLPGAAAGITPLSLAGEPLWSSTSAPAGPALSFNGTQPGSWSPSASLLWPAASSEQARTMTTVPPQQTTAQGAGGPSNIATPIAMPLHISLDAFAQGRFPSRQLSTQSSSSFSSQLSAGLSPALTATSSQSSNQLGPTPPGSYSGGERRIILGGPVAEKPGKGRREPIMTAQQAKDLARSLRREDRAKARAARGAATTKGDDTEEEDDSADAPEPASDAATAAAEALNCHLCISAPSASGQMHPMQPRQPHQALTLRHHDMDASHRSLLRFAMGLKDTGGSLCLHPLLRRYGLWMSKGAKECRRAFNVLSLGIAAGIDVTSKDNDGNSLADLSAHLPTIADHGGVAALGASARALEVVGRIKALLVEASSKPPYYERRDAIEADDGAAPCGGGKGRKRKRTDASGSQYAEEVDGYEGEAAMAAPHPSLHCAAGMDGADTGDDKDDGGYPLEYADSDGDDERYIDGAYAAGEEDECDGTLASLAQLQTAGMPALTAEQAYAALLASSSSSAGMFHQAPR